MTQNVVGCSVLSLTAVNLFFFPLVPSSQLELGVSYSSLKAGSC